MTHANEDEPMFDIDGYVKEHHDKAWKGDGWEIPVATLLFVWFVWFFLGGVRGVLLFAPLIIWVLLGLVLKKGLSVFLVAGLMLLVSVILLLLLFS